jgi:hypothetical protein
MPLSPRERLAQALDAIGDYAQLAHKAGVTPRDFLNAQSGRICPTVPFLRICVAVRHDPMPELPYIMPEKPSDFDFGFLSMAFQMKQAMRGDSHAAAARRMGFRPATIRRIERGDAVLIGVIRKVCKYIEIHPFGYLAVADTPSISKKINEAKTPAARSHVSRETLPRKRAEDLSPLAILIRKRGHDLRRAETTSRALERLEGKAEYADAFTRHQRYLASVAALTLSIDQLRQAEGKEVRVLGSLAT